MFLRKSKQRVCASLDKLAKLVKTGELDPDEPTLGMLYREAVRHENCDIILEHSGREWRAVGLTVPYRENLADILHISLPRFEITTSHGYIVAEGG